MPQIGEIQVGSKIGKRSRNKYIWLGCVKCGKERWVLLYKTHQAHYQGRCFQCASQSPTNWRGGRVVSQGYIFVKIYPDDHYYSMAHNHGYVLEHRLIAAKRLGRVLHNNEIVHHKNGIRNDNRSENLELTTNQEHATRGYRIGYEKGYADGVRSMQNAPLC